MSTDIMDEEGKHFIELVGSETRKGTIGKIGIGRVEIVNHGRNGILELSLQHVDLIGSVLVRAIPNNDIDGIVNALQHLDQRNVYLPGCSNADKGCQLILLGGEKVNGGEVEIQSLLGSKHGMVLELQLFHVLL